MATTKLIRTFAATFVAAVLAGAATAPPSSAATEFSVEVSRGQATINKGDQYLTYAVTVKNTGDTATSGTISLGVGLQPGLHLGAGNGVGWSCDTTANSCMNSSSVPPGGSLPTLNLSLWVDEDIAADSATTTFWISGGGASSDAVARDTVVFGPRTPFGVVDLTAVAKDLTGDDSRQAGSHPFTATSSFFVAVRSRPTGFHAPVESIRNVVFHLPPGFIGNPEAIGTTCQVQEVTTNVCPESAAVGGIFVRFDDDHQYNDLAWPMPLFRVVSEDGYPAAFAFRPVPLSSLTYILRPKLRSGGDYGISVVSPQPPQFPVLGGLEFATLCGYGANMNFEFRFDGCKQPDDPDANAVPFLTNPTECPGTGPVTRLAIDSYQDPGAMIEGLPDPLDSRWKTDEVVSPTITGCDDVPFAPSMTVTPTVTRPDSASGLDVDLSVPQDGLLSGDGIATAHLKKTVVELPEGFSVNPSAATGLQACSDEQLAKDRMAAPDCPEASKLGTVEVTSPLVDQSLTGEMYLGEPKSTDPQSGDMLRLFLSVRNDKLGVQAKLVGSAVADPVTGRLTATFDDNPRVPFDSLKVKLKDGPRGVLSSPQECGPKSSSAVLSPWSATTPVELDTPLEIDGDCTAGFDPKLTAGNSNRTGRASGTFSFEFSREDGEQWLRGLTAKLPTGLLASVKDVPLCKDAEAAAGACPAASKIGIVDAAAGSGNPFVLERKGEVFLTEGYKGGEYGLMVKVRAIAGPFRGDMELSPIVVRQAIHVDPTTAQVTAISDPLPQIWHGVPLRVRKVTVLVNRDKFMLNPSDCAPKQIQATIASTEGTVANVSNPFQASHCADLAFKPKLKLSLTGRKQTTTGKHPGVKATVTQQDVSEAGIEKAVVRLPKSIALDPENAQALCEFTDGTKSDLENRCPKGSIVGRARAKTPLLKNDLVGNVYFVKNVRIDPTTGNQIRTLPMIIVALRGEISINLRGESSTTKAGKLVNTFADVPDAPISQFNLNINGGDNGILAVTRTRKAKINLCAGRHIAETDMDGHNGRRHDTDVRMKTPCTKRQAKAAKRAAARRAAKGA